MPIFEYFCDTCLGTEEVICKYDEMPDVVICPYCDDSQGGPVMHSIISAAGFRLHGDGYYKPTKKTGGD